MKGMLYIMDRLFYEKDNKRLPYLLKKHKEGKTTKEEEKLLKKKLKKGAIIGVGTGAAVAGGIVAHKKGLDARAIEKIRGALNKNTKPSDHVEPSKLQSKTASNKSKKNKRAKTTTKIPKDVINSRIARDTVARDDFFASPGDVLFDEQAALDELIAEAETDNAVHMAKKVSAYARLTQGKGKVPLEYDAETGARRPNGKQVLGKHGLKQKEIDEINRALPNKKYKKKSEKEVDAHYRHKADTDIRHRRDANGKVTPVPQQGFIGKIADREYEGDADMSDYMGHDDMTLMSKRTMSEKMRNKLLEKYGKFVNTHNMTEKDTEELEQKLIKQEKLTPEMAKKIVNSIKEDYKRAYGIHNHLVQQAANPDGGNRYHTTMQEPKGSYSGRFIVSRGGEKPMNADSLYTDDEKEELEKNIRKRAKKQNIELTDEMLAKAKQNANALPPGYELYHFTKYPNLTKLTPAVCSNNYRELQQHHDSGRVYAYVGLAGKIPKRQTGQGDYCYKITDKVGTLYADPEFHRIIDPSRYGKARDLVNTCVYIKTVRGLNVKRVV